MRYSTILGTGSYLPTRTLSNEELSKMVDTSDEWILSRTGMKSRHVAGSEDTPVSMAEAAAKIALERAGVAPHDLDLIVVTTVTPEHFFPSVSCQLHGRLGVKEECGALDLNAACTGFIYALTIVDQFIRSGAIQHALIVSSETLTHIVDWTDRNTCVLFGDGAGAVVVGAQDHPGIVRCHCCTDGTRSGLFHAPTGLFGARSPAMSMQGPELFKVAVESMIKSVKEVLSSCSLDLSEIDWLIPHQANARILDRMIDKLHFPREKVILTIDHHSNTSSASIPLALDWALTQGKIQRGQRVILEAFAAGLTWGSVFMRY